MNSRQEPTDQIRIGEACQFQIDLKTTRTKYDVAVGLHVKNEAMQRVTSFHSRYHQSPVIELNRTLTLACKCPELMLVPGRYVLELAVSISGRVEDRVDHAFTFSVIDSDVFGTGKTPPLKDGILVSRGYWEVSQT
jgi:hypothetical protein